jgi:hypothetical protein
MPWNQAAKKWRERFAVASTPTGDPVEGGLTAGGHGLATGSLLGNPDDVASALGDKRVTHRVPELPTLITA